VCMPRFTRGRMRHAGLLLLHLLVLLLLPAAFRQARVLM